MKWYKKLAVFGLALCLIGGLAGSAFGLSAYRDELISGEWTFQNDVSFLGDITTGGTLTLNGVTYTWPATAGTNGYQLTTDGTSTLSWAAAGTTAWDDITNPDNNKAIDFTDYYTSFDCGDDNHDMFTFQGTGAFGDYSIVKIEQVTGDPTDGTVLEVVSADADADALLVTANSVDVILVNGDGTLTLTGNTGLSGNLTVGNYYVAIGTDPADAGAIRLANAAAIEFEAAPAAADVNALSVDASEVVQIGSAGASGVTITPDVSCTGDISAVDGTFSGNVFVTGTFQQDALTAATAATTITLDGTGAGGVTIGGTSIGDITLGGGATLVNLPATVDMTISGGDFAVTDTANADMVTFTNNTLTTNDLLTLSATGTRTSNNVIAITDGATQGTTIGITANTQTSGHGIKYSNSGAGLTGAAIDLEVTDGAGFLGDYIRCYDGSAEDFTVERYGEVTVAGNAGSDMLTITAGNFQMGDGDIDVDDGFIAVNTDEDHASYITRAFAGAGSGPAFTVTDSNSATTQPAVTIAAGGNATTGALTINQTGTGNAVGIDLNVSGDYAAIDIDAGAARDGDVIDMLMTNMLDERAMNVTGAITAAAGEGTIEIHSTGQVAATGSLLRLDNDTAQAADGSSGYIINVDDDTLVAATPVVYAVLLDSNANGALSVTKGLVNFSDDVHLYDVTIIGDAVTDNLTVAAGIQGANALIFDGATDDTAETTLAVTDPSTDNTITLPDYTGAVPIVVQQGYTQTSQAGAGTSDVTGSLLTLADGWFVEGSTLKYTVVGSVVGANAAPSVALYFEDGAVCTLTCTNGAAGDWQAEFIIIATASNSQRITGRLVAEGGVELITDYATDNTDISAVGTIPVKVQITSGNAGDTITSEMVSIEYWLKAD